MGRATLYTHARSLYRKLLPYALVSAWLLSTGSWVAPQSPNPPPRQPQQGQAEQAKPTFQLKAQRNLVTVKVVVRDRNDRPVGNLRKEDFRLSDDGKPQDIIGFTVEAGPPGSTGGGAPPAEKTPPAPIALSPSLAQRFIILFFDDLHLTIEEAGRTRNAAWEFVTKSILPQDRVAIFTSSGQGDADFTDDRDKLHKALFSLVSRVRKLPDVCPDIGEYQAYETIEHNNQDATKVAFYEAYKCDCLDTGMVNQACQDHALSRTKMEARQVWLQADTESQDSLQRIDDAIRRLSAMPGQRRLVLVSPGFLTETRGQEMDAITARALRQEVVVSAIDAAGLMPRKIRGELIEAPELEAIKTLIETAGTASSGGVLAGLSAATGGVFFHNSNDFGEGFRQGAAVPEVYYVLTFSPPNIVLDGKFHSLKVTVNRRETLTVQARRGYFATEAALAGRASGQDELEKVVFSLEEIHGLPAQITAQSAPTGNRQSKLTVVIHVDVRELGLRRQGDRSVDKLIFHTTLFDRDGKYVAAKEASLDLHLKDATITRLSQSGIFAKTSFPVLPGTYRIREVVRDTESKLMSALNYVVEVPGSPAKDANH